MKHQTKNNRITIRLTNEEAFLIKRGAREREIKESAFVRQCLDETGRRTPDLRGLFNIEEWRAITGGAGRKGVSPREILRNCVRFCMEAADRND